MGAAYLSSISTVIGSTAVTVSSGSQMNEAPARSLAASIDCTTASAVSGSPSWKVTPSGA